MRVAAVQHDITWCDREANLAHLAPRVAEAAAAGARLVLLSETFSTGFAVDRPDLAEPPGGPTSRWLATLAREHDVWLGGTFAEVPGDGDERPFNTFVLVAPDGTEHRYRKRHRFAFGGEDEHFRAGEDLVTVDVEGLRVSLLVCYDLRFADDFWALAEQTDVYLVPACWPQVRREHWLALLRARAIENQAWVVGCNRVGQGGPLAYAGDTCVVDPWGEVVAAARGDAEQLVMADVTAERVAEVRRSHPFLADRRSRP